MPGLDRQGADLWTLKPVICPFGEVWTVGACTRTCALPPHTSVHSVLDLGNSTWSLDGFGEEPTFTYGAAIVVTCAHGAEGSLKNWTLHCADGRWDGRLNGTAVPLPDCTPIRCNRPSDPVGSWLGALNYNSSLVLQCADGYLPHGGASILRCLSSTPSTQAIAVCIPGGEGD